MTRADDTYSADSGSELPRSGDRRREPTAAERLKQSYRIPLVATCVFVVTMLAIWLMGRQLGGHYAPSDEVEGVEWVRSD